MRIKGVFAAGIICYVISGLLAFSTEVTPSTGQKLNGRDVVLDDQGLILPWYNPNPSVSYDYMFRLCSDFMRQDLQYENGKPIFYCRSEYRRVPPHAGTDWFSNPVDILSGFIHSYAEDHYGYTGEADLRETVIAFARDMILQGSTPDDPDWAWRRCPYSDERAGVFPPRASAHGGAIMPHMVAKLGFYYIWLYKMTDEYIFLNAACACADALAENIRPCPPASCPWPFRALPDTNAVFDGQDYCAAAIEPVLLFDELISLGIDPRMKYSLPRDTAFTWIMSSNGPMVTHNWTNYFEDAGYTDSNHCQITIGETARFLLEHPDRDDQWPIHVRTLIHKMETMFGAPQYGAMAQKEQYVYMLPMISHTARYASVCALYWRATGEPEYREKAYRALNWATYGSCPEKDRVFVEIMDKDCGWFTDCHGDYLQHIFSCLASVPEWAPEGEDHLLHTTSVIQKIEYRDGYIVYRVFDGCSEERFRLKKKPVEIVADGFRLPESSAPEQGSWTWTGIAGDDGECRILHIGSKNIIISWSSVSQTGIELEMPSHKYHYQDDCWLKCHISNPTPFILEGYDLLVVLDIMGEYWFAPDWTHIPQFLRPVLHPGPTTIDIIQEFHWPDLKGATDGLIFWSALLDPQTHVPLGDIASWSFGWE